MAASEDELAKKQIQEAIWTWAGRVIAMVAVFTLGAVSGFWLWGYGPEGAIQLRQDTKRLEAEKRDINNKRVDIEGKLTVVDARLASCTADLQKCRAAPAATP